MYPQSYLQTFWRLELRPTVFVAMSFAPEYQARFDEIIAPAIRDIMVGGTRLEPVRVDLSKSGDSILTDIVDGIAHSRMFLADVSSMGNDSKTGRPYRNANVMYEVGIAVACRQSEEVLLVRDDHDPFLFDTSTIPHTTMDFADTKMARILLNQELVARIKTHQHILDARVQLALSGLSNHEATLLRDFADLPAGQSRGWNIQASFLSREEMALSRLLDKQLIRLVGKFEGGFPAYDLTPLGRVVAGLTKSGLQTFKPIEKSSSSADETGVAT